MSKIVKDVAILGNILGIWAHPDDETWTSAGIMYRARKNKQKVICINATKGELGVRDEIRWPTNSLGRIRAKELTRSLNCIGSGIEHHWLTYRDGDCSKADDEEAVQCIYDAIKNYRIDTILTFGPDGLTGHPDHRAVSNWAHRLVAEKFSDEKPKVFHVVESKERYFEHLKEVDRDFNIYFNIDIPPVIPEVELDMCIELDAQEIEVKLNALRIQESQTTEIFHKLSHDKLCKIVGKECFVLET